MGEKSKRPPGRTGRCATHISVKHEHLASSHPLRLPSLCCRGGFSGCLVASKDNPAAFRLVRGGVVIPDAGIFACTTGGSWVMRSEYPPKRRCGAFGRVSAGRHQPKRGEKFRGEKQTRTTAGANERSDGWPALPLRARLPPPNPHPLLNLRFRA